MEQSPTTRCDITKCPLNTSITVAEEIIDGFDDAALQQEPAHSIAKQTRLARAIFDRMRARLECDGAIATSGNHPVCPMNISDPMSLLSKNGETVHEDGYYLPRAIRDASGDSPHGDNDPNTGHYM